LTDADTVNSVLLLIEPLWNWNLYNLNDNDMKLYAFNRTEYFQLKKLIMVGDYAKAWLW